MFLNTQPVKLRGFNEHSTAVGVGMALPARMNLMRMQQLRGMGSNAWRSAHNAGEPSTFALADRLGMTVLDENRLGNAAVAGSSSSSSSSASGSSLATAEKQLDGSSGSALRSAVVQSDVDNWMNMIRRDRVHPSVLWWSTCNEGACSSATEPTYSFKIAAEAVDGSRAITGNMFYDQVHTSGNATAIYDVQGE